MLIEEVSNSNSVPFFFISFVWTADLLIKYAFGAQISEVSVLI